MANAVIAASAHLTSPRVKHNGMGEQRETPRKVEAGPSKDAQLSGSPVATPNGWEVLSSDLATNSRVSEADCAESSPYLNKPSL
jgi:hypothetical protein